MDSREFVALCQALDHGETCTVRNLLRDEEGRAVRCDGRRIEVEIKGRRASWAMENSEL